MPPDDLLANLGWQVMPICMSLMYTFSPLGCSKGPSLKKAAYRAFFVIFSGCASFFPLDFWTPPLSMDPLNDPEGIQEPVAGSVTGGGGG